MNITNHRNYLITKNAGTDGKDIGADIDAIEAATKGVVEGYMS